MYLHIYVSAEIALEHENHFNAPLDRLEADQVSWNRNSEHEKQYAFARAEEDYGFFDIISNEVKDSIVALDTQCNKDIVT